MKYPCGCSVPTPVQAPIGLGFVGSSKEYFTILFWLMDALRVVGCPPAVVTIVSVGAFRVVSGSGGGSTLTFRDRVARPLSAA
jgi:hypothetical protein